MQTDFFAGDRICKTKQVALSFPQPPTATHDIHPYPTIYDTTHPSMHVQPLAQMLLHSSKPPMPPISHAIPPIAIHDPSVGVLVSRRVDSCHCQRWEASFRGGCHATGVECGTSMRCLMGWIILCAMPAWILRNLHSQTPGHDSMMCCRRFSQRGWRGRLLSSLTIGMSHDSAHAGFRFSLWRNLIRS